MDPVRTQKANNVNVMFEVSPVRSKNWQYSADLHANRTSNGASTGCPTLTKVRKLNEF